MNLRRCFRDPIPEIFDTVRYLDAAVSAHLQGEYEIARKLFTLANEPKVRSWLESIWGKDSPYVSVTKLPLLEVVNRIEARMPTAEQIDALHQRDGYHCRYCGIPVIRAEIRKQAVKLYPEQVTWGQTNSSQHAGFQALWAQYDHVVPHSAGGANELENLVVSCTGCNFGLRNLGYKIQEIYLRSKVLGMVWRGF